MSKNKIIILAVVILAIAAGAFFFSRNWYGKEYIGVGEELDAVEFTEAEKQALQEAGVDAAYSPDQLTEDLSRIRTSDDVAAIEADLNETDLEALDSGL